MQINIHQDDPFDIEKQSPVIFDHKKPYYDFCHEYYFHVCKNVKVLEIGAGNGDHSKEILKHIPEYFEIVEGDNQWYNVLKLIGKIDNVTIDDAMMFLQFKHSFDVVICLGVLYHLHSPLHLLELIINNCQPKIVILDCVMAPERLEFKFECENVSGNNQHRPEWRGCKQNLVIPFLTYLQSMDYLGYDLVRVDKIQVKNWKPKQNCWMASWRIKNAAS